MTAPFLSIDDLYAAYEDGLADLCARMSGLGPAMLARGQGAGFSDLEGEMLYLLIRALRPDTVWEMSPDCGFSTNYILAALADNAHGRLFSLELEPRKGGRDTRAVILENLVRPDLEDRWELVIGDARESATALPDPDFFLIDSCHDAPFAEWYLAEVVRRTRGPVFIQDVLYADRPEASGEASLVLRRAEEEGWRVLAIGRLESDPVLQRRRGTLTPRRPYQSNSIVWDRMDSPEVAGLPFERWLGTPPATRDDGPLAASDPAMRLAEFARCQGGLYQINAHRRWLRLARAFEVSGEAAQARRCYARGLGAALAAAPDSSPKGPAEAAAFLLRAGRWRLGLAATMAAAVLGRRPLRGLLRGLLGRGWPGRRL